MRGALAIASLAAAAATAWALASNPLLLPFAERAAAEGRAALEAAVARRVDEDWLLPRLEAALAAEDVDRAEVLLDLAGAHGVSLPEPLAEEATALVSPNPVESARICAACAWDPAGCMGLAQLLTCGLPFELTPLGDVNALRRQAAAWLAGAEVDQLETGLALAGLGATALVPVSGGGSATVKAGATVARVAHRSGRITPAFSRVLADAAAVPVAWHRLDDLALGRVALEEVVDTVRLARLGEIGADLGRLIQNTSTADTLGLLRHVEDPADLARLVRISENAGETTRPAVETLGLARAFRATTRVSDLVLAAAALLAGLAVQLAGLAGTLALRAARRSLPRG
jgi:hypothetical protein